MDEEAFQEFKWEILGDAALEDYQMVWEPLGSLRGSHPEMDEVERQGIAERVLRELCADGLIYFFRTAPWPADRRDTSDDPASRLTAQEIEQLLSSDDWRTIPAGSQAIEIEFGATEEGFAAARERWPV